MTQSFETIIIGAGQAGLATAYHLAGRDRSFVVLEARERVGDNWRERFDSLRLYSPARYDGLPGWPMPLDPWTYPTKDQMADYLEAYAERFELPVITGAPVDSLRKDGDRYVVRSGAHRFEADNVVVASGTFQEPDRARVRRRARPGDQAAALLPSTATRRSCRTAPCSSSAAATPAPTSRSRWRQATRRPCPAAAVARCRSTSRAASRGGSCPCCGSPPTTS